jgi:hypothetical protein
MDSSTNSNELNESKEQINPTDSFECIICYESKPPNDKIMSRCAHGPYCSSCYNRILLISSECSICKSPLTEQNERHIHQEQEFNELPSLQSSPLLFQEQNLMYNNLLNHINSNRLGIPYNSTIMSMLREINLTNPLLNNTPVNLPSVNLPNNLANSININTSITHTRTITTPNQTLRINTNNGESNVELFDYFDRLIFRQGYDNFGNNLNNSNLNNSDDISMSDSDDSSLSDSSNLSEQLNSSVPSIENLSNYINSNIHRTQGRRKNSNGVYSCNNCRGNLQCTECDKFAFTKVQLISLLESMDNI